MAHSWAGFWRAMSSFVAEAGANRLWDNLRYGSWYVCQSSYITEVYHNKKITILFMLKYFIIILANYLMFMSSAIRFQIRQYKQYYFWCTVVLDLSVISWLGTLFCVGCWMNINLLIVGAWLGIYSFGTGSSEGGEKKSRSNLSVWQARVDKVHSKDKQQIDK